MRTIALLLLMGGVLCAQGVRPVEQFKTKAGVVKITPIRHASMMTCDCERDVCGLEADGSIYSVRNRGAVNGMWTAAFSSTDHVLKAVLIFAKVVQQTRPSGDVLEVSIVRSRYRCKLAREFTNVFQVLGE